MHRNVAQQLPDNAALRASCCYQASARPAGEQTIVTAADRVTAAYRWSVGVNRAMLAGMSHSRD